MNWLTGYSVGNLYEARHEQKKEKKKIKRNKIKQMSRWKFPITNHTQSVVFGWVRYSVHGHTTWLGRAGEREGRTKLGGGGDETIRASRPANRSVMVVEGGQKYEVGYLRMRGVTCGKPD